VLTPFFRKYDVDNSRTLSTEELGLVFSDMNEPKTPEQLAKLFEAYDADRSGSISFDEFCDGMKQYVLNKPSDETAEKKRERRPSLQTAGGPDDEDEDAEEIPEEFDEHKFKSVDEQQAAIKNAAFRQCLLGTCLVVVFSDPITDVLDEVGARTGINAFYVGFVVAPLITNGSELLASYTFALKKTSKSIVVAYEQLLGAAVLNNSYCLFIFLALIYAQNLYWDYTAEVLALFAAEVLVFLVATQLQVHTMKTAFLVLTVYPLALALVWCLESLLGFS